MKVSPPRRNLRAVGQRTEQLEEYAPMAVRIDDEQVIEALRLVYDPELGVNIVDLGLVYGLDIDDTGNIEVIMTLTSMGCPLGPVIERDVKSTVGTIPGVKNTKMTLTFSPPWDPSRMTEDARMELGYWG
jgi:metal-sulfur cluster biosynthetic enzyme